MAAAPGAFSLCDSADDDLHLSEWLMEASADWVLGGEVHNSSLVVDG